MEIIIFFTPIALLLLAKYWLPKSITFFEVGIGILLISLSAYYVYHYDKFNKVLDKEVWNGKVLEKVSTNVNCEHSYECNCRRSGSSETCLTCYEHNYDVDWILRSTIGDIAIPRVEPQGAITPPAWLEAYKLEPVSRINVYENYIQGAESSLFNGKDFEVKEHFTRLIPHYPTRIYDNYRFNHAISVDLTVPDLDKWNHLLAELLKELGPKKQVNVLLLIVNTQDSSYIHSLEKAWFNGKKNDVVVVVGSTNYPLVDWVDVMSWSPSELFKVQLRDEIAAIGTLNPEQIVPVIERHVSESFIRFEMSTLSHLKNEINSSKEALYLLFGILVVGSFIFSFVAHKYEISNLLAEVGVMAAFFICSYYINTINFFVIFFGFIISIVIWLVWSNYNTKRKKINSDELLK